MQMTKTATPKQRLNRGLSLIRAACAVLYTAKVNALETNEYEFDTFSYQLAQLFDGCNIIEKLFEEIKEKRSKQ